MAPEAPTFDQLMWPALRALKAMGGSGTNSEILEKVIEIENYPEEIQTTLSAGKLKRVARQTSSETNKKEI